ncbi:MAG: phosphoribosylglycinamide formyltransferase [Syntrophomonadaceae bacterium]|nr:phosphoribosylglycinamide formyltransferase [Syntrophomonadaceae bacterium]
MSPTVQKMKIAVMASGRGSNFIAIQEAILSGKLKAQIAVLVSDQQGSPVLRRAEQYGIPTRCFDMKAFADRAAYETAIVECLREHAVELVALAGYMRIVGPVLLQAYPQRIVNIHPALLPAFPGMHAQRQAVEYGVKISGCTIHLVDEGVDTGPVILQAAVPVLPGDDEERLATRILVEEHKLYPRVLQYFAEGRIEVQGRQVTIMPPR